MTLKRCLRGTPQEMADAAAAIDVALGYPRRGVHVGGGIHCPMPDEWDGKGEPPPGWTKSASEPIVTKDGDALLPIGSFADELRRPEVLLKLSAAQRQLVADARDVDVSAELPVTTDSTDSTDSTVTTDSTDSTETPIGTGTIVAIGAGVVAAAAAAYEIANQLGLFN